LKKYLSDHKTWIALPLCLSPDAVKRTYYHFVFAVLLPLLNLARRGLFSVEDQTIQIESCGLFDGILRELDNRRILNISIRGAGEIRAMLQRNAYPVFYLDSLETYQYYGHGFAPRPATSDGDLFRSIADFTKPFFLDCDQLPPPAEIIVINRKRFAQNQGACVRTIPNAEELVTALETSGYTCHYTALEGTTLKQQIDLFAPAKIIIAQHGSALSNIIWSSPAVRVIELVPAMKQGPDWQYFSILCDSLDLERAEVYQEGPFDDVDPSVILKTLETFKTVV